MENLRAGLESGFEELNLLAFVDTWMTNKSNHMYALKSSDLPSGDVCMLSENSKFWEILRTVNSVLHPYFRNTSQVLLVGNIAEYWIGGNTQQL